jgi:hypothetical protein
VRINSDFSFETSSFLAELLLTCYFEQCANENDDGTSTTTAEPITTVTSNRARTVAESFGDIDCLEAQDHCTTACKTASFRNHIVLTPANKDGKVCIGPTDCRPFEGTCRVNANFDLAMVIRTQLNDGAVSCAEYCQNGVNGEAVVGSMCTAAVRGVSETIFPPSSCIGGANEFNEKTMPVDGQICIPCTKAGADYTFGASRDPLTCWCSAQSVGGVEEPTNGEASLPNSWVTSGQQQESVASSQQRKELDLPHIILDERVWEEAGWFGTDDGWDSTVPLYSEECDTSCKYDTTTATSATAPFSITSNGAVGAAFNGSFPLLASSGDSNGSGSNAVDDAASNGSGAGTVVPPPTVPPPALPLACRLEPYTFSGIHPNIFRRFLKYQWGNGTQALVPAKTRLAIMFSLEWDRIGGHGATGPGGFQINATDGGIPAAIPQQAGFFSMLIRATVRTMSPSLSVADVADVEATIDGSIDVKRFGFRVEGLPPFQVREYDRPSTRCDASIAMQRATASITMDAAAASTNMTSCHFNNTIVRIDCFSGSSVWIAPVNLTSVVDQIGSEVEYALEGEPDGCLVDSETGEILIAPQLGTEQVEPYLVDLIALDEAGSKALVESFAVHVSIEPLTKAARINGIDSGKAIGGVLGTIICMLLVALGAYRYHAHHIKNLPADFENQFDKMLSSGLISEDQLEARKTPREINRNDLNLLVRIGAGAFGEVWKAMLDESKSRNIPEYTVAAKTVLDSVTGAGTLEMLSEAAVMAQVSGHPNLVQIVGVVSRGEPLILVMSYCEHGSLLAVLKTTAANGKPLPYADKMGIASEVALGMGHLHGLKFVHRDLAARNVLLSAGRSRNGMVAKVADFGLSRLSDDGIIHGADYVLPTEVFPVRWTAPEAMQTLRFTAASDVWSFGIVVIELLEDGVSPYHGKSNPDVMNLTLKGDRHPQPLRCTARLYDMLLKCWAEDPTKRPSCTTLGTQ